MLIRPFIYCFESVTTMSQNIKGKNSEGNSFAAYFKRATSPLVMLRILSEKAMYGYEISQEMKTRSQGQYTMSALYPVLRKLFDRGYIQEDRTEVVHGRARTYYAITDAGHLYFREVLYEYHEISKVFDELMAGYNGLSENQNTM